MRLFLTSFKQKSKELGSRCDKFDKKVTLLVQLLQSGPQAAPKAQAKAKGGGRGRKPRDAAAPLICRYDYSSIAGADKLRSFATQDDAAAALAGDNAKACFRDGFIIEKMNMEALLSSADVDARVKYLAPKMSGDLPASAQHTSAALRRGQVVTTEQLVLDKLKSVLPAVGPHKVLSADDLTAKGAKKEDANKVGVGAVWGQRSEPEGRYIGSEFGEVGVLKATFEGSRKIVIAPFEDLVNYFQADGERLGYDQLSHQVEVATEDVIKKLFEDKVLLWTLAGPGSLVYVPQGHLVIDATVGTKPSIGVKLSVLISGVHQEQLLALQGLYKVSGKVACADFCGHAASATVAVD